MTVRIVVDDFGLYQDQDAEAVLSSEVNLIQAVRKRIYQRLRTGETSPLVLHMSSAIFCRFQDLAGQPGLEIERVSPRHALRERLGCPSPFWLEDRLVLSLLTLAGERRVENGELDPIDRVLALLDPILGQTTDLSELLRAFSKQSTAIKPLLSVGQIKGRLKGRLAAVGNAVATELLALFIDGAEAPQQVYRILALAFLRERLDYFGARDGLTPTLALPPRLCSKALVQQLPPLPIAEADAAPYPEYLRHLLIAVARRTHDEGLPVHALADYVLQDWPGLLDCFQTLFEQEPGIASVPLILALHNLSGGAAGALATRMQEYLDHAHCDPLAASACVNDVLRWSARYFRYAIAAFERDAEPDEGVGESFARWVVGQQNRIIQSEYDWRVVARTVDEDLAAGNLVILCIVDALGAIHMDLIELELRQRLVDQREPIIKPLFARLPTITEVGKIGVLTGLDRLTPSADYEKAVRERFAGHLSAPGALQIVKSWKDFRQALSPRTRLLVCLDNRVDDDLHQCTEFRLHRERVRAVAAELAELIANWLLDAARFGTKATILITGDHGATKVSRSSAPLPGTVPVERRLLQVSSAPESVPEGFAYVAADGQLGGWLIPHARLAFGSTANLLHGGLTPEEVLIPFIRIAPGAAQPPFALHLTPAEARCHAATKGWYVNLCLVNSSSETFLHLKVVGRAPFAGESQPISRLDPFETQTPIILNLTASVEQQGKTRVPFDLRYQPVDGAPFQSLTFELDLELSAHLMEHTAAASHFNDFFDL
ncbi:alkaline phosphatase [uncultured Thiodictyon sp.]|uniref:alkaline phosphatase n=1 Tax=uncultured Thiodictyon sp. TaxID=1846217 RepID=UPI0025E42133|nr:alkaline phosphatase [uncultured Thiodictyon sp.]